MLKSWLSSRFEHHPIFHLTSASNPCFWSDFPIVKQPYFILLHNCWKFTITFFHPYLPYFHQNPKLHSSTFESIIQLLFLELLWGCEATILYVASKILKLIQDIILHIWCDYAKIHIISSSHFLPIILSSFCPEWSIVKEVPFIIMQMVWKFYSDSIYSNNGSPQIVASFHLAIYSQ